MDCEAIRDEMLDVLYGEGGEAAARRVEAHQATCGECRREIADLRRLRADLSHWRRLSVRLGHGTDARALADLERRHREELAALRAELAAVRPPDDRQLLRTVADMIRESESRQDEARLASLRVLQQRTETQRQYDLARMSAGLSYLDGKAGLQAARTTELVGHLLQASQQK